MLKNLFSYRMVFILLVVSANWPIQVLAQEEDSGKNKEDQKIYQTSLLDSLLSVDHVLDVVLEGEWSSMDTLRYTDEYQKASIKFYFPGSEDLEVGLKVKPRGKFRRKVCALPPLKLNFSDKDLKALGLNAKFDKFKLVTDCIMDAEKVGQDLVLREYLAYKMYQQVESDKSFRVKLLRITFRDKSKRKKWTSFGFLIEDDKEVASRLGVEVCDCMNVDPSSLEAATEAKVGLYQYMVGNVDWSYRGMRNLKMFNPLEIEHDAAAKSFAIPYDFDFSGLVAAPYAVPMREIGQDFVRERFFLGSQVENDVFWEGLQPFLLNKAKIFALVANQEYMSKSSKEDLEYYLESFYDEMIAILKSRPKVFVASLRRPKTAIGATVVPASATRLASEKD